MHTDPMNAVPPSGPDTGSAWGGGVLLVAALLSLWYLSGHDLWAPDEPYFAEGAREMLADGEWAVPHVNGVVTTDKPPLFFWLIALFSAPLGQVGVLTARLPSVLAGLGTVALTVRMGQRLSGNAAGALAGLMLATSYLHWDKSRTSQIDALLEMLVFVSLSAFVAFRSGAAGGRRAGLLFWAAAAAAVLAKGPVGLLLPLGIALVTLALDRNLASWRRFAPLSGPLLFLAVVAAWALFAWLGSGGEYSVWGALREHVLQRALYGMHHAQPPWYYIRVLPVVLLPWSGLVPGALLLAWRRRDPFDRFLLVFSLFVVIFFSLSTEKRDLYILPACPAFALMAARLVGAVCGRGVIPSRPGGVPIVPHRRWVTVPLALTATLLACMGTGLLATAWIGLPEAAGRMAGQLSGPAIVLGAVMALAGVALFVPAAAGNPRRATGVAAAGVSIIYLVAVTSVLPALDPDMSARAFALQVKEATAAGRSAGGEVVTFGLGNLPEAIAFYSDGVYLREVATPEAIASHLARPGPAFAVADAARLAALPDEVRDVMVTLRTADLNRKHVILIANRAGARGRSIPAGTPPPGDH